MYDLSPYCTWGYMLYMYNIQYRRRTYHGNETVHISVVCLYRVQAGPFVDIQQIREHINIYDI